MEAMTHPETVATQYESTERLDARRSVWGPGPEGVSPADVLRTAVVSARPTRVLEIGCGTGAFARSVVDEVPGVQYLATDSSAAMVESTRGLGLTAERVSADSLPFEDGSFDVVVAAWMLYHVRDLDETLAEVRRVLRDGGVFAVATNGERHAAELLEEAGGEPLLTQFTSENAREVLGRHFQQVTQRDVETRASFEDHAGAAAYLATFAPELAEHLPHFDGPRQYAGHTSILTAR